MGDAAACCGRRESANQPRGHGDRRRTDGDEQQETSKLLAVRPANKRVSPGIAALQCNLEKRTDDSGAGVTPITYMNSTAAIKAFCGERGGVVCTSSNADGAFQWGFAKTPKLLFLPDQHLGRNTGYNLGIPLNEMVVWDPYMLNGGLTPERLRRAKVILWKGHCSVHQRFLPEHVDNVRAKYPGIQVIVHPECRWEVCQKADGIGSTEGLLKMIRDSAPGTMFAVGTEIHLVNRMGKEFAAEGKKVITLDDSGCLCTTMFRISPQHLCWVLGNLVEGNIVNQIKVKDEVKYWARVALDRMLEIS